MYMNNNSCSHFSFKIYDIIIILPEKNHIKLLKEFNENILGNGCLLIHLCNIYLLNSSCMSFISISYLYATISNT